MPGNRRAARALTAAMGVISAPQTLSIALGAGLSLVVDYRVLLVLMAAVTALCAVWLARAPAESPTARSEG